MFLGGAILPNAFTYSICDISFIALTIITCSFFENIVLVVVSTKVLELLVLNCDNGCVKS